jgi:hypothetical protein
MWKQWTNVVLGILVLIGAYSAVGVGWVATGVALMTILALWAGIESMPAKDESMSHAH